MRMDLMSVVDRACAAPFMTKSAYARENADLVAAAASQSLITTRINSTEHGRRWRPTPQGLRDLWRSQGITSR